MKRDSAAHHDQIESPSHGGVPDQPIEYPYLRNALLGQPVWEPPSLEAVSTSPGTVSIDELVDAEAVTVHTAPPTVGVTNGETPVWSAKDVRLGRAPSRWGNAETSGAVTVRKGDVAVVVGTESAVQVCMDDGVLLGPGVQLLRVNVKAVDPHFLAGVLRAAVEAAVGGHIDLYQVAVPRLPLAEQRCYGVAFEQLIQLEAAGRRQRENIEHLVRVGFSGLAHGRLHPVAGGE
ncbi:hypothetical protein [Nocardia sp. NBC_01388]|uniref:hypothetical protein n=1 Tax=Nocardia sp. NBC_01388 TaxID=2903596 RepID=UPI00324A6B96